jgi:copper(I)-binding protein
MQRVAMAAQLLALALALAAPAAAQDVKAGALTLSGLVVRAVPAGVPNTAGYLTIENAGDRPDRLLSASCACARKVEAHLSHVMDGQAMMMPSEAVDIPAHGKVVFAPGGRHLMVVGLKGVLKDGASQPMQLKFEHAGTVTASFEVKSRIEAAPR